MSEDKKGKVAAPAEVEPPLPPYWDADIAALLKRAEAMDVGYRHRMIKKSATNQQRKRLKGWLPLEDKEHATKLGFDPVMINSAGRVEFMDCELWRMPMALANRIRRAIADKRDRRHNALKAQLAQEADELKGRTKGLAEMTETRLSDEVLTH